MKRSPDHVSSPWRTTLASCGVALTLCVSACSDLGTRLRSGGDLAAGRTANSLLVQRLADLSRLARGDTDDQAALLAERRALFHGAPSPATALDYALALGRPGHDGQDSTEARALLQLALSAPGGLDPVERALAETANAEIELRLKLEQDNRRLADEVRAQRDATSSARTSANRRLQAELEENSRLRKALDEAKAKLQAVAALEKATALGRSNPESRRP